MNNLSRAIIRVLLLSLHDLTNRIMMTHVLPRFSSQYEPFDLTSYLSMSPPRIAQNQRKQVDSNVSRKISLVFMAQCYYILETGAADSVSTKLPWRTPECLTRLLIRSHRQHTSTYTSYSNHKGRRCRFNARSYGMVDDQQSLRCSN